MIPIILLMLAVANANNQIPQQRELIQLGEDARRGEFPSLVWLGKDIKTLEELGYYDDKAEYYAEKNETFELPAGVYNGYFQFCGGVLVHRQVVLTAAHCVNGTSEELLPFHVAVAGDTVLNASKRGYEQFNTFKSILVHPEYKENFLVYGDAQKSLPPTADIALVLLEKPFDLEDGIVEKAIVSDTMDVEEKLQVAGWGLKVDVDFDVNVNDLSELYEHEGYGQPLELQTTGLIVASPQFCERLRDIFDVLWVYQYDIAAFHQFASNETYGALPLSEYSHFFPNNTEEAMDKRITIDDSMFCALSVGFESSSSCSGDSGGPLYNRDGAVVGLVSFGPLCGTKLVGVIPGVYANLTTLGGWVRENIDVLLDLP